MGLALKTLIAVAATALGATFALPVGSVVPVLTVPSAAPAAEMAVQSIDGLVRDIFWSQGGLQWPTGPWPVPVLPGGSGGGSDESGGSDSGVSQSGSRSGATSPATDDQSTGLALINTEIGYGEGVAAGTGMVIGADGIVVTNHHVVAGSTSVQVNIPATGETYTADVLGYDATADVAVLRLDGASGLETVTASTGPVDTGDSVTAVGNASGGGQLIAAPGTITATDQDITVSEEDGSQSQLTDLLEMNAAIVPGDSGGAVFDADGDVVGMNVAGSSEEWDKTSYAIPITTVLEVARDVLAGDETDTVVLGRSGALGVEVSDQFGGLMIAGVVKDGPADQAGVTAGSTLTSVDGSTIKDTEDLGAVLDQHEPGDRVAIEWTSRDGRSHTATVSLTEAPLD